MAKKSAGLLMYRRKSGIEVLLVHPGGPFWRKKDLGAWTVPKGEVGEGEELLEAARREFQEETGVRVEGHFVELTPVELKGGKVVHCWAVEGDCDAESIRSNTFEMEWPPGSGKRAAFPEVDRAGWFTVEEARGKILAGLVPLIEELEGKIA